MPEYVGRADITQWEKTLKGRGWEIRTAPATDGPPYFCSVYATERGLGTMATTEERATYSATNNPRGRAMALLELEEG